ncbi:MULTISPECIES: cell division protein FtsL [Tepidimonas]|uniref:Cell division protein FtsL n=1 Tax=Tepidimonas aquatica TaxID=247482 RepID=A0A554WHR7_9BURK|nr:cell division protein FtsL [Tepidimonas aquatica]TSE23113.1 Cell division protein FtsL [Tepidimonas aquatica]
MTRLNLLLLAVLLASSFHLVELQHQSRRLYVALERARAEGARLQADHERLVVEQRALAAPARVQQLARQRLHMHPAHPGITEYVALPVDAVAGGAAP